MRGVGGLGGGKGVEGGEGIPGGLERRVHVFVSLPLAGTF